VLTLFPSKNQLTDGKLINMAASEAVKTGTVANETLAYFLARTALFAEHVGLDAKRLRFRQHLPTEMAHYASDCWDLEVLGSYGWIECVGHADRSCYDLEVHSKKSKVEMLASQKLDVPKMVEEATIKANKGMMGKVYKKELKAVIQALDDLDLDARMALQAKLDSDGNADCGGFNITKDMVKITKGTKKVSEIKYTPGVIEPSFGVGRLIYHIFEHSFYLRENDEKRGVMAFKPAVAPIQCALLPLSSNDAFTPFLARLDSDCQKFKLNTKMDRSNTSIGRRYARMDEIGVPFCVTVDFDSTTDSQNTVTMRERDSTVQIQLPLSQVAPSVRAIRFCPRMLYSQQY
jgi:glycyl-tRNA synthetase